MKNIIFLIGLSFFSLNSNAQTDNNIRLHILMKTGLWNGTSIKTTLNPNNAIKLRAEAYTLINADADSIGILFERHYNQYSSDDYRYYTSGDYPNSKSSKLNLVMLSASRGHDYYFVIASGTHSPVIVNEVTENAFKLNLAFNNYDSNPEKIYNLPLNDLETKKR